MMKIIKKISIEKMIFLSIMIFLIGIPTIIFFCYNAFGFGLGIIDSLYEINRVYLLWYSVPVLFILYILDLIFNKKAITFIDILMYLLALLGAFSTIYAVDMGTSIYGEQIRNEGLLSLLAYYLILLDLKNMTNEKYKNIIIKTLIIIGVVQVIYGLLQVYTIWPFIIHFQIPYMASGLCGNANFMGSYMVILASFTFSMYMLERKRGYLILSIIFFMGICLSSSSGPFLSFILMIIFFALYYRRKIKWKCFWKTIFSFVIVYLFIDFSVKFIHIHIFKNTINPNYNITMELGGLNGSNLGNGRIKIWKESFPLLKKYWVVGAGLDNFGKVYGFRNGRYYDKAHNVYLQIAITNGVFALILYLILIVYIFFKGLKLKNKVYISLFMAFICYNIQAFVNISAIEVAPAFFAICGILLGKIQESDLEKGQIASL